MCMSQDTVSSQQVLLPAPDDLWCLYCRAKGKQAVCYIVDGEPFRPRMKAR